MAKEYVVAEYGHEERKELGRRVGMGKGHQIESQTKLSKNENYVAEFEQKSSCDKISVTIKIRKVYKKFVPEKKRTENSKKAGRSKNEFKKIEKATRRRASEKNEAALCRYAERKFPSVKPEPYFNALIID